MERCLIMLHTVVQGEHLAQIAEQYGFADYHSLWNLPQNASLQRKRKNPDQLVPGDEVFIPDKTSKHIVVATNRRQTVKLAVGRLRLRVVVHGLDDRPASGLDCMLEIDGKRQALTTDGGGLLDIELPPSARGG